MAEQLYPADKANRAQKNPKHDFHRFPPLLNRSYRQTIQTP
jgi:hypothetical protein